MTDITLDISGNSLTITNNTGHEIDYLTDQFLIDGTESLVGGGTILNGVATTIDLVNDGIYKITNDTDSESDTIILTGDISSELEDDVKEILLADDIQKILPKGYDFITLALISIIYIGNSIYHKATYNVSYLTKYTAIAVAIDRCSKYFDRQGNTPQSTNKLWQ